MKPRHKDDERPIISICRNKMDKLPKDTDYTRYRWCSCLTFCQIALREKYRNEKPS